jgi:alkanesulfonate monooxygenase SsuD/methylene tetrahydromethanopterin reductase-like flavin-dependent oxidoreductase (luciferase family)
MRAMVSVQADLGLLTVHNVGLEQMREDWGYLDRLGICSLWLGDHYGVPRLPELPLWETWTLLAVLAGQTSRSTLGTLVTNVAMRNPAVLAKQITTVDHLSGGRLIVGLGTGYYEQEHAWVGVPFPPARDRVTRLGEAVEILDRLLRGERFRRDGEYFKVDHAPLFPRPVQHPRPPFMVGAFGARSLDVVATRADAWSFAGRLGEPPESALRRFRELGARLDDLCVAGGRAPAGVRRSYLAGFADEHPFGSTDAFDDVTGRLVEAGTDEIVFYFMSEAQQQMRSRGHRWVDRGTLEQLIADGRWRVRRA